MYGLAGLVVFGVCVGLIGLSVGDPQGWIFLALSVWLGLFCHSLWSRR